MAKRQLLFIVLSLLVVTPLFHNCGEFKPMGSSVSISGDGGDACDAQLIPIFKNGYHKFFTSNVCKSCHVPGGQSKAHFAQPSFAAAYHVFAEVGPDLIKNKLSAGHYRAPSYDEVKDELDPLMEEWDNTSKGGACALGVTTSTISFNFFDPTRVCDPDVPTDCVDNENIPIIKPPFRGTCNAGTITCDGVNPAAPAILPGAGPGWTRMHWRMSDVDGISADLAGVEVQAEIKVAGLLDQGADINVTTDDFANPERYLIRNLAVKTSKALVIKSVQVLLNGQNFFVTTYDGIDRPLSSGADFQLLIPGGGSAASFVKPVDLNNPFADPYKNGDAWSVHFGVLEAAE